jgi:hypothetical protein
MKEKDEKDGKDGKERCYPSKKKQGEASGGRDGGSVPSPEVDNKGSTTIPLQYRTEHHNFFMS